MKDIMWQIYILGAFLAYLRARASMIQTEKESKITPSYDVLNISSLIFVCSLSWVGFIIGAIIKLYNKEKYWFRF